MNFKFRAYLANGGEDRGTIEAADKQDALRQLIAKGRRPFFLEDSADGKQPSISKSKSTFSSLLNSGKVNPTRLFYDLAMLTEAGLTITQALRSIRATEPNAVQRQAVETIEAVMATGKSASQSFTLIPEIPRDALGLIASGESAARLPAIFRSLSVHHEEREKARAAMLSALAYPAFLFVLMLLAIGVITFVLVPSIEPIFENAEKPAPTIVSALSLLRSVLLQASVPLGLALIAMGCLSFLTPVRRYFRNLGRKILLRLPIAGKVIAKRGQSQYLSSLSILLENGGTMANALLLSAECNPIHAFTPALLKVRERVTTGSGLTSALRESELFDERILSLISVGDEAGKLSFVCARAAKVLENEAQAMLAKFLSALTPAITIALGLLIGGLVISVMTALLSINDLALQ